MTGAGWKGRRVPGRTVQRVETADDWHGLLALAQACADDSTRGATECAEADTRRSHLGNRINAASTGLFDRRAGAATSDTARAFVRLTRAFARRETPESLRREMAPMVADGATFLDLQLHRLRTADFERAHAGRPEVYG